MGSVRIENVTKKFGEMTALDNISSTFEKANFSPFSARRVVERQRQ